MTFMRAKEDGTVTQSAIDFLITNKTEQWQNPQKLECGFSDHDAITITTPIKRVKFKTEEKNHSIHISLQPMQS